MKNWLIRIFSFRNKAVKKITRYQKQESMPEIESPKNTDRPPEPDFLNTNTRLQLLSRRKKNTRNATRSWACCCLRSTSTWSAWWTATGSCYWFLFDILFVWSFWLLFEVLWVIRIFCQVFFLWFWTYCGRLLGPAGVVFVFDYILFIKRKFWNLID